jgi:hypothetical protein
MLPGIGDFIALATLATRIAKALGDSYGSSAEYQDLTEEFKSLSSTLTFVVEQLSDVTLTPQCQNIVENITSETRSTIEKFHKSIESYAQALGSGASHRRRDLPRNIWYKICWSLFKKGDIVATKTKLTQHQMRIQFLLMLANRFVSMPDMPKHSECLVNKFCLVQHYRKYLLRYNASPIQ